MADNFEDFKLKVFVTVARRGSFTIAAKELGVTQPAISQNINSLEKSLGVQLFQRVRGDVSLTDAGRTFLRYALEINYWYDSASRMFGGEAGSSVVKVRVAADSVCADYILPKALATLMAGRPDIIFEVVPVADGDADACISASPAPAAIDFEAEGQLAGTLEAAVAVSALNKQKVVVDGLHVSGSFAAWDGYRSLLPPDICARVKFFSYSAELVKEVVRTSGHLVGILPAPAVAGELLSGEFVSLPLSLPELSMDIHFVASPGFERKNICKLLFEAVKQGK